MRILVCIKQVPDTAAIRIDPESHTLIRQGVPSIVNPFDMAALGMALQLRDGAGGEVAVLCMGPQQAEQALRTCLAYGADEAWLACDNAFAGSDTLATGYILAAAVREIERRSGVPFDLILCGRMSIDGDTGQVGPQLAERLGMVSLTNVTETEVAGGAMRALRMTDEGFARVLAPLPALLCVANLPGKTTPPSLPARLKAEKAELGILAFADLALERERVGLAGSPTHVLRTTIPTFHKKGIVINGDDPVEAVTGLIGFMKDKAKQ